MEIYKDLEVAIVNDNDIKSIDVVYEDGKVISGFAKNITFFPFELTLCQHRALKGENPLHYVDFSRVVKISLIYHNGKVIEYN